MNLAAKINATSISENQRQRDRGARIGHVSDIEKHEMEPTRLQPHCSPRRNLQRNSFTIPDGHHDHDQM